MIELNCDGQEIEGSCNKWSVRRKVIVRCGALYGAGHAKTFLGGVTRLIEQYRRAR